MSFIEQTKQIDMLLNQFSSENESKVVVLLRQDKDLVAYFFKNVELIEWFSTLRENGYFSYKNNPAPIPSKDNQNLFTIPYWQALTYLEKVAKKASITKNIQYAKDLMDILRGVTCPENKSENRVDNYRTWYMFAKIMGHLPNDVIDLQDIDLVEHWLDSKFDISLVGHEIAKNVLPKFLKSGQPKDIEKAVRLVEIVTSPKSENKTLIDADDLEILFKKNAELLGQYCGKEIVSIFQKYLEDEKLFSVKDDSYGYVWRSAIQDHEQNPRKHESRFVLISGLRDVLLAYLRDTKDNHILEQLWKSTRMTVKRVVIFAMNHVFQAKRCAKFITDNLPDLFLEPNYHYETFELIKARFQELPKRTQSKIIEEAQNLTREWREDMPQEEREEMTAHIRRRWLHAIHLSGHSLPPDLIAKYGLNEYKPEHPEFLSYHWSGSGFTGSEQLFSVADLMENRGIKEVVDFLNQFEGKNRFNEIGYEEAGQVLKEAVKINQTVFEKDLLEFKKVKLVYQYYVIQAFEEIWNSKRPIDWGRIFEFFHAVIDAGDFWKNDPAIKERGDDFRKDWIPSLIARFIQSAVRNDEWVLPNDRLKDAQEILETLLDKVASTAKGNESDALTEAINSTKGHAIEAYLNFALRQCRVLKKEHDNKGSEERKAFWKDIEPVFDKELDRTKYGNFEFSALAGRYLPNLYYLSAEWTKKNINQIFPTDKQYDQNWRCAISGYAYVNTVYNVIYELLKDNGHFKRVLDSDFDDHLIRERIIENIAIAYLRERETLEGGESLFAEMIRRWESRDMCDVIDLFWQHRDEDLKGDEARKIRDFWKCCFEKIKGHEADDIDILSDLNLLAAFLPEIDSESKAWLMQSAPYVEHRRHSYFFLESLDRLADTNPKDVGDIYVAMVNQDVVPRYEEENIRSIVEKIYKAGEKSLANQICDRYKRGGDEFLQDLYDANN